MLFSKNIKKIHFIGIGGISMSGLAEIAIYKGFKVSGSDIQNSHLIEKLVSDGALINIPHDENNISDADLIVYTSAVKEDNPEMIKARELELPIMDRATFLGSIMKTFKYGIAVAGCHGKTTTTSIISLILKDSDLDPTVLIGGELDAIGGNVRIGGSPYFITEACEYMENFLKFHPFIGVILNVGEDHLDYFRDLDHIKSAFLKFAKLIPKEGCLVLCNDDPNTREIASSVSCNIKTYGIKNESDYMAKNIKYNKLGHPSFKVFKNGEFSGEFNLGILGEYNILNSLASIAVSDFLGIPFETINKTIEGFKGTHRRFELKGTYNDITVIDDYAHHPTEIKVTLEAARKTKHNKIWCIFQPHTYTRTKALLNEFANSFNNADKVIISDIYASREKNDGLIHSKDLTAEINKYKDIAVYIDGFDNIARYIAKNARPGDLVMTVGAGNITDLVPMILSEMRK